MSIAHAPDQPASQLPTLTRLQRRERTARALAESGKTRSASRRLELLDYVVRINMGVASSVARRYVHRGIEEDDLAQVAYAALVRAARGFDPSRDQDFLSYAVPTIRGELKKHFRDRGWVVRPPRRIQEIQAKLTHAEEDLAQELGRRSRPDELAAHLQVDVDEVREAMAAEGCFSPSSLDRPLAGLDGVGLATVGDMLGEEDRSQAAAEARVTLAPVLRRLKERDRRILYMRFFEQRTQQEIADDIGVTQMQVSRLLSRIMRDLRDELGHPGDSSPSDAIPQPALV
jgi:RNA polymerase sigma-B factor